MLFCFRCDHRDKMNNVLLNNNLMGVDVRKPRNYRHRPSPLLDTFTDAEIRDRYRSRLDSIAFICDIGDDDLRRPTHRNHACLWKRKFSQVRGSLQVDVSTKWMQIFLVSTSSRCLVLSTAFANLSCRRKIVSCAFLSPLPRKMRTK